MNGLRLPPTGAELEIRRRIKASGSITFAEFMAIALHWPDGGYYSTRIAFGPAGDFYTAPLTHPVFGALIARQIDEMWRMSGSPSSWWIFEPGAGNGRLASDVVAAVACEHDGLASCLHYLATDVPFPAAMESGVEWARATGLPVRKVTGVVLANELFDAMPVHRVTVRGGRLRELRVGVGHDGELIDVASDPVPGIAERLAQLEVDLSEGHIAEVCLEAEQWLSDLGAAMTSGYLLMIDYGHEAKAYYDVSRNRGTLRTYYRHTLGMNPYLNVGQQDISVHVEFTSVREAARIAGFRDVGVTTQTEFLRNLGFDSYHRAVESLADLRTEAKIANVQAMDSLLDQGGMGGFKVMAFTKGLPPVNLTGFAGGRSPESVPALLAGALHMPLPGLGRRRPDIPTWDELLR